MPPLSLDGSYNLSGNQPIQTLLFVTQCSSTCRDGYCGALLCAHDLEEEVVVTVKVQLYRTSEIVVSRWLGAWSMAMAALLLVNRWQSKLIMVLSRSSHNHNNKGK